MSNWYILEGTTPKKVEMVEAAKWLESNWDKKKVAFDESGDIRVSTVFLGLDHQYDDGKPLIFETMIFGGKHDEDQWRYSTWDEAVQGHKKALKLSGIK